MNVSPHFQQQYQVFRERFISSPALTQMMVYYGDRLSPNPTLINPEVIMFDYFIQGWMARERQQQTSPSNQTQNVQTNHPQIKT